MIVYYKGGSQHLCWGSAVIGGLLSAYFSGSLLEVIGPTDVFKITAVLPLLVALNALFTDEEPTPAITSTTLENEKQMQLQPPSNKYKDKVIFGWYCLFQLYLQYFCHSCST